MFKMNEFLKKGYLDAVGKMPDYWIILNATGYMTKGLLTEKDLEEINKAIEKQYEVEEEPTEEPIEEVKE